jgi:hypothetical protein
MSTAETAPTPPQLPEEKKELPPAVPIDSPKKPRRPNPWLEHVKEFRQAHPELKTDVLKKARETYKKSSE